MGMLKSLPGMEPLPRKVLLVLGAKFCDTGSHEHTT